MQNGMSFPVSDPNWDVFRDYYNRYFAPTVDEQCLSMEHTEQIAPVGSDIPQRSEDVSALLDVLFQIEGTIEQLVSSINKWRATTKVQGNSLDVRYAPDFQAAVDRQKSVFGMSHQILKLHSKEAGRMQQPNLKTVYAFLTRGVHHGFACCLRYDEMWASDILIGLLQEARNDLIDLYTGCDHLPSDPRIHAAALGVKILHSNPHDQDLASHTNSQLMQAARTWPGEGQVSYHLAQLMKLQGGDPFYVTCLLCKAVTSEVPPNDFLLFFQEHFKQLTRNDKQKVLLMHGRIYVHYSTRSRAWEQGLEEHSEEVSTALALPEYNPEQGIYLAIINIAGVFRYSDTDSLLRCLMDGKSGLPRDDYSHQALRAGKSADMSITLQS